MVGGCAREKKDSCLRLLSILASAFMSALGPPPALAQRSVEFGYKDRIFEQKYVLPDNVNAVQLGLITGGSFMQALQSGGSPDKLDPALMTAAGGTCAAFFVDAQAEPPLTDAQAAIRKFGQRRDSGGWDAVSRSAVTQDKKCVAQLMLFRAAYADSFSTQAQLAQLASAMRSRFASEWLSQSEIGTVRTQQAAQRLRAIWSRLERLSEYGIDVPSDMLAQFDQPSAKASLLAAGDERLSASTDARLSDLEAQAATSLQQRSEQQKADAKRAAEAERQAEQQARQERRLRQEQEDTRRRAERQLEEEMNNLRYRREKLDGDIRLLRSRLVYENKGNGGIRLTNQLNAALSEQAQIDRRLRELNGAPPPSSDSARPANQAANMNAQPTSGQSCGIGGACRVLELTLFCRTPQQMAAILSQPPGPARKQVLGVLSSSGDCRQVAQGEAITWTSAITTVQPSREPVAELVPGTLADGTAGFMLKDGVIARTASANR